MRIRWRSGIVEQGVSNPGTKTRDGFLCLFLSEEMVAEVKQEIVPILWPLIEESDVRVNRKGRR